MGKSDRDAEDWIHHLFPCAFLVWDSLSRVSGIGYSQCRISGSHRLESPYAIFPCSRYFGFEKRFAVLIFRLTRYLGPISGLRGSQREKIKDCAPIVSIET